MWGFRCLQTGHLWFWICLWLRASFRFMALLTLLFPEFFSIQRSYVFLTKKKVSQANLAMLPYRRAFPLMWQPPLPSLVKGSLRPLLRWSVVVIAWCCCLCCNPGVGTLVYWLLGYRTNRWLSFFLALSPSAMPCTSPLTSHLPVLLCLFAGWEVRTVFAHRY